MKIRIEFESEGFKIQGKFYHAEGMSQFPTVLLLHGFPGNEDDVLGLGQRISQFGVNVLTFNYRGTYQSEGTYSPWATLQDIQAAIKYLQNEEVIHKFQIDTRKLILGGYSYGGGMALTYTNSHPEIQRVFSIAGTDHGEFVREYKRNPTFAEIIDNMFKEIMSPNGPVRFASKTPIEALAQDLALYDLRLNVKSIADRDLLLIGAWDDHNVTLENHIIPFYRELIDNNAQKVQITALQDNHAFERSRKELAETIIRWLKS